MCEADLIDETSETILAALQEGLRAGPGWLGRHGLPLDSRREPPSRLRRG